jgi:lipopolysaccharide export system permease protein
VLVVLLVIFMSNQFADILGDAAADGLPRDAVMTVFGLTFVSYLTALTPIALLLGVMLALARLNRDSESAALAACGFGPGAMLRPIGLLSLLAAAGVAWLTFVTAPAANKTIAEIRFAAQEEMELGALRPGSFTTTQSGCVLYARDAEAGVMRGVFTQCDEVDRIVVVVAERGERVQDSVTGELSLRLTNGRRYEGAPGEGNFFVAEFEEHGIPIRVSNEQFVESIEARSTLSLLIDPSAESRAEIQRRIAGPLSTLLLVLLAVPLSRSSPRESRYSRVGVGVLIYIVYQNSLSLARVWMERELVPEWLGMWWAHAALAALAVLLLLLESGVFTRTRPYRYGIRERYEPAA